MVVHGFYSRRTRRESEDPYEDCSSTSGKYLPRILAHRLSRSAKVCCFHVLSFETRTSFSQLCICTTEESEALPSGVLSYAGGIFPTLKPEEQLFTILDTLERERCKLGLMKGTFRDDPKQPRMEVEQNAISFVGERYVLGNLHTVRHKTSRLLELPRK